MLRCNIALKKRGKVLAIYPFYDMMEESPYSTYLTFYVGGGAAT